MKKQFVLILLLCSMAYSESWLDQAYGLWGAGVVSRDRNYKGTDPVVGPGLFIFGGFGPIFIEANRAGYTFYKDGTNFASAVAHLRTHQFRKDDNGLSDRKSAVELGVQAGRRLPLGFVARLAFLHDVIGTHQSYELDMQVYRRNIVGSTRILTAIGIQYQAQELADYYYGTQNYDPDAAYGAEIEIIITQPIANWAIFGGTRIYFFDEQVSDSPIANGSSINQFFGGIGYSF